MGTTHDRGVARGGTLLGTLFQGGTAMINKSLVAGSFGKAVSTYEEEAVVQRQIACKMSALLGRYINPSCGKTVEVGCGTGIFSRLFLERFSPSHLWLNDLCPEAENALEGILSDRITFCWGDAEQMELPDKQDLIVSCSALQWFVSPENFFARCHGQLSENGYLAFSTFGYRNMEEVSSITGYSLPYRTKEELEFALSSGYQVIYSEEETVKLRFDSPLEVLHHLKRTGVTAVRRKAWTKRDLNAFCNRYREQFNDGKDVCLTYHPIYIIVKKKSDE